MKTSRGVGDSAPYFTTITAFVSGRGDDIAHLSGQVLYFGGCKGFFYSFNV